MSSNTPFVYLESARIAASMAEALLNHGAEVIPALAGTLLHAYEYLSDAAQGLTDESADDSNIRTIPWLVLEAYAEFLRNGCLTWDFFDFDEFTFNCEGLTYWELMGDEF